MSKTKHKRGYYWRVSITTLFATLIGLFLYAAIPESKPDRAERMNPGVDYKEGEVLVRFKAGVKRHVIYSIAESHFATVVRTFDALTRSNSSEYAHLYSKHRSTRQLMQDMQKLPEVEAVSPNYYLRIEDTIPDDEAFDLLWGLHNTGQNGGEVDIDIDAPEAWDINRGSSDVIVAVIDTGIDYNHPDLIPNLWINPDEVVDGIDNDGNGYIDDIHGMNAITSSGDPMDDHGHGTHCAGTIGAAGNNGVGVTGVCWNVKMIGAKFIDASGWGEDADALECLNYILDLKTTYGQNIVAVNASFGGGDYDPVFESAIDALGAAGIIFCAAAGNDWEDTDILPHYPSSYTCSNIISVTAVDYYGWQYFNYGKTSVDIAAPGVDILSTISAVYWPESGDIFFDDMESGAGNWITGGTLNTWAISTDEEIFDFPGYPDPPSPPNFWSDSPGVFYSDNTDSWLMNVTNIDLTAYVGQNLYLGFGSAMYFEELCDHGYVEVSGDGGVTWESLYDFSGHAFFWYMPWYFLIPDSVKTGQFRFRFHLVSDFSITYPGWLIDDVGIGTASFYGYSYKMGTSMATPHVTGAVALLASVFPSETVAERIARILENTVHLPSLVDICATEGMLNLYQAVMANPKPEINVRLGNRNFSDGSIADFGSKPVNAVIGREFTFTIENKGTDTLDLTGTPDRVYLSGPDARYFQVIQQPAPSIPMVSQTTFKVRTVRDSVPPLPVGWERDFSVDVNIPNTDSDENPYNFTVKVKLVKY
ncbi:MAG: S8 family serine peptidase [Candidatus Aminicenantes bacterium]|jgi:subtilisin family serine protease